MSNNPNAKSLNPNDTEDFDYSIDWLGTIPFISMHVGCLLVFFTGVSPIALGVALITYIPRAFALTGGYHRYFSHRTYKVGRVFQFLLACLGTTAVQMGPLWWAAHHRNHHKYSDTPKDVHSPVAHGFWWSHMGWIMNAKSYNNVDPDMIKDLTKFPELRWLDRWCLVPPILLAICLFALGHYLAATRPELGTSGIQMLTWAFFISTIALHHATFGVNSVAHVFGSQRFKTGDQSRNNALIAFLTMGEGWHNNHHRFPASERQGIYWWEIDMSHAILKFLSWFGLVNSIKVTSKAMVDNALAKDKL